MLQLKNVVKTYVTGELKQDALKGVSVSFRNNEFVSILGQSGSGKTTMLNIIGGLDRYTSGDLVIGGVSTKKYKDSDWDYYRNHSIGFVFQSYNLIPHQSVLANVELALTLAGVSRKERRKRALEVLERVGLKEHVHKKPNQMSGGQMQRVAIARALINNPDILLADEPTGALDSETSVQIMELLKEIAQDKLVIMVTHNPELAEEYSTRIIKLRDGRIVSDSNPYDARDEMPREHGKRKKISMSFWTALSLSFNNLRTKLGRTLLTAFAGSIGIIGIALILSISTGIQDYINGIQRDTLSSYPISITQEDASMITSMLSARQTAVSDMQESDGAEVVREEDAVYSSDQLYALFNAAFANEADTNNLTAFKQWLDTQMNADTATTPLRDYVSGVQYQYALNLNTYVQDVEGVWRSTEVTDVLNVSGNTGSGENALSALISTRLGVLTEWEELMPGKDGNLLSDLLYEQYDLVAGQWPQAANEIVLILDKNNEITDMAFYTLGLMTRDEVSDMFTAAISGKGVTSTQKKVSYDDVLGTTFKLVLNAEYYTKNDRGIWEDIRDDEAALDLVIHNGYDLKIVGILRPNPSATATSTTGTFAYTSALTEYVLEKTGECAIVQEQLLPENENYDVLTGLPFVITEEIDPTDAYKAEQIRAYFATITPQQKVEIYTDILSTPSQEYVTQTVGMYTQQFSTREAMLSLVADTYKLDKAVAESYFAEYTDEELQGMLAQQLTRLVTEKYAQQAELQVAQMMATADSTTDLFGTQGYAVVAAAFDQLMAQTTDESVLAGYYDAYMPATVSGSTLSDTLATIGSLRADTPSTINIYAATFEDKQAIDDLICDYNAEAREEDQISYTDYVALLMSGVTTMIDAVSYALIGFVSISLIVSSIMIGIITYISVLERTKEIGILRSVGASKKDISRVFNAETVIVGLAAGLLGIGMTLLINIPICIVAEKLTSIRSIAVLPVNAAVILVAISVVLTMIAGLVPSRMAARKDPVIALRSE